MLKQYRYILLLVLPVFASQSLGAVARPNSTITTNNWSAVGTGSLHEAMDDPGPAPYDDTDYITSTKFNTVGEVGLSSVTDPAVSNGHVVRYAARLLSGGGNESIQIELLEGGLPLSTPVSITDSSLPGSYTVQTYNLSAAQADSIGNYGNLSFRLTSAGHRNGEESRITMLEFEVPDSFSPPVISSTPPTSIGSTSAWLGGNVTGDGSDPGGVTDRGTIWKTSSGVTILDNPASEGSGLGPFSHERTFPGGANTIIYYAGYATNSIGTSLSPEDSFRTEPDTQEPTAFIDNAGASDMRVNWSNTHTGDGVIVLIHENGTVDSDPVDGVVYSDDSFWPNGEQIGTGNRVAYAGTASNITVTNLTPGSTYYVAVYAYGGSGPGATGINYIQASPATANQLIIGPPALTTVSSSNVTATGADLEITVSSDGGGTIFEHGTIWKLNSAPSPADHPTTLGTYGGSVPGSFADSISGLNASSLIYFQGYATNGDGTTYSNVGTLYTEPDLSATGINIPTGTNENMTITWISGNGDGAIVVAKVGSAVNSNPLDNNEYSFDSVFGSGDDLGGGNFVVYSGSGTSVPVTNLIPGTTYHFAVFEYKGSGAVPGGRNYKITAPATTSQLIVGAPQISTPSFADITNTTATLGATVISDGGGSVDARGTVWNTTGNPNIVDDALNVTVNSQTLVSQFDDPVVNLDEGDQIYFRGYVTNLFGTTYTADNTFFTEPAAATLDAFTSVKYGSVIVNWTRGNGDGVVVIARQGSAVNAIPADGTIYNANVQFGNAGSEIGTANYVVYAGKGTAIQVVLLSPATTYHFAVYEYNGYGTGTSGINYEQDSPAIGSQLTADPPIGHNYSGGIQCDQCHGLHDQLVPTGSNQSLVCADQCHTSGGAAETMPITDSHRHSLGGVDCGGCHELHNGSGAETVLTTTDTHAGGVTQKNIALIRGDVAKYVPTAIEPALYQFDYAVDDLHLAFPDGDERIGSGWSGPSGGYDGVCQACHTTSKYHRNGVIGGSSGDPAERTHPQERGDYSGQACIACHPHDAGFAPVVVGGSCIEGGCHDAAHPTATPPRREIVGEFSLTSHHVSGGAVTQADCQVCHIDEPGTKHQDGVIDLRDPDTGTQIQYLGSDYSFASLTRDKVANGDALEEWVTVVQDEFCFKCHDSDASRGGGLGGAAHLGASAMTPFSTAATVPEVYGRFNPANTYHHSVRSAGSNPYTVLHSGYTTMLPPWNQDTTHDVISCFDCHSPNGHGDTAQRMLRVQVDFDAMEANVGGTYPSTLVTQVKDFCVMCHNPTMYAAGDVAGSSFVYHAPGQNGHLNSNDLGCMGCHAGIVDEDKNGSVSNGAARGLIHGGSFTWPTGSKSPGQAADTFVVGGWMSGWLPAGGDVDCWGGNCNHDKAAKSYTLPAP